MRVLSETDLDEAALLLKAGELVAFPTETVYGLGAALFLPEAISKIFIAKKRPSDNPLIAHISHLEQLESIVSQLCFQSKRLIETFFPGPLTLILPKTEKVPACAAAGLDTIGVRMPAHPFARKLIEAVGMPVVAPSANLSGKPSATQAQHVIDDFKDSIAAVIEGECGIGLESTVLSLDPVPRILRPGAITAEQIEAVIGQKVEYAQGCCAKPQSPGMKYKHYAPQASVYLCFSQQEFEKAQLQYGDQAYLLYPQSQTLYAQLRQADKLGKSCILVRCDEKVQLNLALMNRLKRAAQIS